MPRKVAKKLDVDCVAETPTQQHDLQGPAASLAAETGEEKADSEQEGRNTFVSLDTDLKEGDAHPADSGSSESDDSSWLTGYSVSLKMSTSFSSLLKIYSCEDSTKDNNTGSQQGQGSDDVNTVLSTSDVGTLSSILNYSEKSREYNLILKNDVDEKDDLPYTVAEYRRSSNEVRLVETLASPGNFDAPTLEHAQNTSGERSFSYFLASPTTSPDDHKASFLESALYKTPRALLSSTYIRHSKGERWSDPEDTIHRKPGIRGKSSNLSTTLPGDSTGGRTYRSEDISGTPTSLTGSSLRQSSSLDQPDLMSRSNTSSSEKSGGSDLNESSDPEGTPTDTINRASGPSFASSYYRGLGNTYLLKRVGQSRGWPVHSDSETLDNFRSPCPVDNSFYSLPAEPYSIRSDSSSVGSSRKSGNSSSPAEPRPISATATRPLGHCAPGEGSHTSLPDTTSPAAFSGIMGRRTSEDVSPRQYLCDVKEQQPTHALSHPRLFTLMSGGSVSDVSSVMSAASRQSLAWEHEFPAPARGANDSLAWEDDPFLESSTSC